MPHNNTQKCKHTCVQYQTHINKTVALRTIIKNNEKDIINKWCPAVRGYAIKRKVTHTETEKV